MRPGVAHPPKQGLRERRAHGFHGPCRACGGEATQPERPGCARTSTIRRNPLYCKRLRPDRRFAGRLRPGDDAADPGLRPSFPPFPIPLPNPMYKRYPNFRSIRARGAGCVRPEPRARPPGADGPRPARGHHGRGAHLRRQRDGLSAEPHPHERRAADDRAGAAGPAHQLGRPVRLHLHQRRRVVEHAGAHRGHPQQRAAPVAGAARVGRVQPVLPGGGQQGRVPRPPRHLHQWHHVDAARGREPGVVHGGQHEPVRHPGGGRLARR